MHALHLYSSCIMRLREASCEQDGILDRDSLGPGAKNFFLAP